MPIRRHLIMAFIAVAMLMPVFADASPAKKAAVSQTTMEGLKINLNMAAGKELIKIKGLTPGKARAIVAYRKKHGNFTSLADLLKVKSVSTLKPDAIKKIQDQLTL